jgi:hypothetical protein
MEFNIQIALSLAREPNPSSGMGRRGDEIKDTTAILAVLGGL